jgi:outer membrane lipoprotein carrier protein
MIKRVSKHGWGAALMIAACAAMGSAAAAAGAVAPHAPAAPASPTPLLSYLDSLKSLRATFLQIVTDAHGKEIDRSTGNLLVVRPGKLRWEIHPQGSQTASASGTAQQESGSTSEGQLMVADGRNLWFYDRDLQQVTVKPADAALSATPAMLLSGAVDIQKSFRLTPAGKREGLDWTLVEPRGNEADFRRALFGFDHDELKRMILEDKLGQTATVMFDKVERNGPVSPDETTFSTPAGVDVIGKPR